MGMGDRKRKEMLPKAAVCGEPLPLTGGHAGRKATKGRKAPGHWWADGFSPMVSFIGGVFLSHLPLLHAFHPLLPGSHAAGSQGGDPLLPHARLQKALRL